MHKDSLPGNSPERITVVDVSQWHAYNVCNVSAVPAAFSGSSSSGLCVELLEIVWILMVAE